MKRFIYKARSNDGKVVIGEVEAQDQSTAARLVKAKGLILISISPKGQSISEFFTSFNNRISPNDVANFTRQFATMINAGLPITDSLSSLKLQSEEKLSPIIGKILADVENGDSLSVAFSKYPQVFSSTYIALLRAGETGGVLDKILLRIADNLEKAEEFKGKVIGALIYPIIIVIGMIIVSFIMMIFVIPRLLSLYTQFNAALPLPTLILINISNFFIQFWYLILAAAVIAFLMLSSYIKTKPGKYKIDELIFKLPIIGDLQRKVMLADLARTLALMIGAGVPIIEGMDITAGAISNNVIKDALIDAKNQIEKGFPISFAFAKHKEAFPYIFSQMIAVGEESGKIDEVLSKLAQVFETESNQKVKTLTAAIEPIVMVILGVGVGFLVVAVILPIYNLTNQF
jgi:type IV pilus assembly protein PilC